MSSLNTPNSETTNGPQGPSYQFSVLGLLVVLTTASLVLATFVGVGRAFGMTHADMLQYGFGHFLYLVPLLIVWTVGLALAVRQRRYHIQRSNLLIAAFGGMLATSLVTHAIRMVLIHYIMSGAQNNSGSYLTILGIADIALNTTWWILILVAIFSFPKTEPAADHNL